MCRKKYCYETMKRDGLFRGGYDALKWLISNYSADNQDHRKIAKELTFGATAKAVESGLSIVIDGGFADYRDEFKTLALENNFVYLSINIEAPVEVLEKRFLARVESAKVSESKPIAVTTLEGFHSRYQWYINENKDSDGITFDSEKLTPEEIVVEIDKLIENNK